LLDSSLAELLSKLVDSPLTSSTGARDIGVCVMLTMVRRITSIIAFLICALHQVATAQAGNQTNNLTVTMTVTASCTINAATLTFPSTAGTSITSTAVQTNTNVSVTCTNSSPYAIGMGQGANYSDGSNRMTDGSNDFLPYGLYVDSGYTHPWTTAASSTTCTTANDCYLGTGTGSAQSIPIYGQVPTVTTAPVPGTYSDTVLMTITF
jgi:spore coat protein U-like protein